MPFDLPFCLPLAPESTSRGDYPPYTSYTKYRNNGIHI